MLLQLIAISLLDLSILKVIPQRQVVSINHALFYISTSCFESENEVLQDYLLCLSLQRKVSDFILSYSEPTSTFIFRKSINLCIRGKLNDKIINGEIFLRYQLSTNAMVSSLGKKRCSGVVTLALNKEDVLSKPLYIPVDDSKSLDSGHSISKGTTCCFL